MKALRNSLILFGIYAAFFLLLDLVYVKTGQHPSLAFEICEKIIFTLPLSALITLWLSMPKAKMWVRVLVSIGGAALLSFLGVLGMIFIGIFFHLWIGGSL